MARTQGTFTLPANVETYAAAPLDARDRVATKNDLTAEGSFPYPWIGMETYVVSENKKYRLIGSDPTVLANWEEVGSGSGGASNLNDLDDVNITSAINGQVLKYDSTNQEWVNADENASGHTIKNPSGTSMTDRSGLKFAGDSVSVSDDSTNDQTIVTMPNLMAAADISEIINPLPDPVGTPDLEDLGDVNISSASNGQVLKYDSSSSKWINAAESGGGASDLNDLDDVNIAFATDGQILKYDATNDQWINANEEGGTTVVANPSGTATTDLSKLQVGNDIYGIPTPPSDIDDLSDVEFTSLTNGQILKYDSTASKWVNADESSSAGGHIIENASGTDMTQRTNLQFTGDSISLSDDSTNDRTVVAMPNLMAAADISEIIDPLPDPIGTPDLDELGDVNISSVTNGQVLKYDSASSKWINANESGGGGVSDLEDLDDVDIISITDGQILKYDSTNQVWVNANESGGTTVVANPSGTATTDLTKLQVGSDIYGIPEATNVEANPSGTASTDLTKLQVGSTIYGIPEGASDINDLNDVNITSVTNGQVLKYDSTSQKWINTTDEEGTVVVANPTGSATVDLEKLQVDNVIYGIPEGVSDIDDLSDVEITTPSNGQVLKYDSVNSKWINANESSGGSGGHTIEDDTGTSMTERTNLQFKGSSVSVSDDSTNDRTVVEMPDLMLSTDISEIIDPLPDPVGIPDIEDLGDVNISSLSNGQVLKYDATNQEWVNANESGGGASDLDDLSDVNITSPISGQVLKYDSQNQEWINANDEGGTTVVANPSGTATVDLAKLQVGSDIYEVPDTDELSELTDVNIASATNGQVLKYDSTSGKWVNANESGGGFGRSTDRCGFVPVGTVISYFGESAPTGYLICDGTAYNKTTYPRLWSLLSSLIDTTPYIVDGDNTKFKVPDLRGEFLRGTGTNSHSNQGDGTNIGTHQDATEHVALHIIQNGGYISQPGLKSSKGGNMATTNPDKTLRTGQTGNTYVGFSDENVTYETYQKFASRPTNTSVLYCIAYDDIYSLNNYSTTEQVVGTWVNGKPLYQKTYVFDSTTYNSSWKYWNLGFSSGEIDTYVDLRAVFAMSSGEVIFMPYAQSSGYSATCYIKKSTNDFYIKSEVSRTGVVHLTLQYTKTADQV